MSSVRRGRRSAEEADARRQILEVARREFEAKGYAGVSVRGVARSAGVNAALVTYYFPGKRGLFLAAMQLPQTPVDLVLALQDIPVDQLGRAMVRSALNAWGAPEHAVAMSGVVLQALDAEHPFRAAGEFVVAELVEPLAARLPAPDARQRAALAVTQMSGLVVYRQLAQLQPLVQLDDEYLVEVVGDVIQRYLTGDLDKSSEPTSRSC